MKKTIIILFMLLISLPLHAEVICGKVAVKKGKPRFNVKTAEGSVCAKGFKKILDVELLKSQILAEADALPGRVVKTLSFVGDWIPATLTGSLLTPVVCQTESYLAGEGEVAIISVRASVQSAGNDFVYADITYREDLNPPQIATTADFMATQVNNTVSHVSNGFRLPLTAGKSYVFAEAFSTTPMNSLVLTKAYCSGHVVIVRE